MPTDAKPEKPKTNNPNGRPPSPYRPPDRSLFGVYEIPPAANIILDLRKHGGNLQKFLEWAAQKPSNRELLLVAILDKLQQPENEPHYKEWARLIQRNEEARLALLKSRVINSLEGDPDDDHPDRKPNVKLSDVKFLFAQAAPRRSSKVPELTDEEAHALDQQAQSEQEILRLMKGE